MCPWSLTSQRYCLCLSDVPQTWRNKKLNPMKSASKRKFKHACKYMCIYYYKQRIGPRRNRCARNGKRNAPLACAIFFNKVLFCRDFDLFLFLWNLLCDSREGEKYNQLEINVTLISTKINLLSLDTTKLEYRTKWLYLSSLFLSPFIRHLIYQNQCLLHYWAFHITTQIFEGYKGNLILWRLHKSGESG